MYVGVFVSTKNHRIPLKALMRHRHRHRHRPQLRILRCCHFCRVPQLFCPRTNSLHDRRYLQCPLRRRQGVWVFLRILRFLQLLGNWAQT